MDDIQFQQRGQIVRLNRKTAALLFRHTIYGKIDITALVKVTSGAGTILNLLSALKKAGFPKAELEQVAVRIAVQTGATIPISF